MEISKPKMGKTNLLRYPAPYSWSNTGPYVRKQVGMKKTVSSYENSHKAKYLKTKTPCTGSDPYAPHLKYGIFPRRSYKDADGSKIHLNKSSSDNRDANESKTKNIGQSEEPYFIIRPLHKRFTKQLSLSEVLHVDIQPRNTFQPMRASSSFRFNKKN